VQANLAAGQSLNHAAKAIVKQAPHIHVAELITVLKESKGELDMVSFSVDSEDPIVRDAIFYAKIAVAALPETTAAQLAVALKDPRNFPQLTALQMGEVLKAEGVFPQITAQQMQEALVAAQYSAADASAAVAQLFPKPTSYRRLGPVGASGQMPFDDNAQATTQPLNQLIVRHGNIIDSIQAFYGSPSVGTPVHGGNGGGPTPVPLSGDPIIEVSGYTGYWFGADYVLQITIKTRSRTYGPFGNMDYASGVKTPFAMTAQANEEIVGFFGSAAYGNNGQSVFLGSLGVIIKA
jgi:hypothetical protein